MDAAGGTARCRACVPPRPRAGNYGPRLDRTTSPLRAAGAGRRSERGARVSGAVRTQELRQCRCHGPLRRHTRGPNGRDRCGTHQRDHPAVSGAFRRCGRRGRSAVGPSRSRTPATAGACAGRSGRQRSSSSTRRAARALRNRSSNATAPKVAIRPWELPGSLGVASLTNVRRRRRVALDAVGRATRSASSVPYANTVPGLGRARPHGALIADRTSRTDAGLRRRRWT